MAPRERRGGQPLLKIGSHREPSLFPSDTLLQEWIALEETGDGLWSIYFDDALLARLDERDFKLRGKQSPMFPVSSVPDVPGCYTGSALVSALQIPSARRTASAAMIDQQKRKTTGTQFASR